MVILIQYFIVKMFKALVYQIWQPLINCKQAISTFFPTF